MTDPRTLIAVLQEINSNDRNVANFTPGLVGMFGSIALMNDFLTDLDEAFTRGTIPQPLKSRAKNLTRTFIPQIAGLNSIGDVSSQEVTAEDLRAIRSDSPASRVEGVQNILAALSLILNESCKLA